MKVFFENLKPKYENMLQCAAAELTESMCVCCYSFIEKFFAENQLKCGARLIIIVIVIESFRMKNIMQGCRLKCVEIFLEKKRRQNS